MSSDAPLDVTASHGIEEGIALALKAEDSGEWKPVADWLAHNPDHAVALAEFLAAQRGVRSAVVPLRLSPDRAGSSLAQFELLEVIGRGAMGVVHRAFDTLLKRDVAVKLLRSGEPQSAVESARFRFEAETVASLHHPNIVPVHTSGEIDGVPYLVMPLMTGGSLAQWLKGLGPDRPLSFKRAAEIVRDVALGVHHAHQRGLIHRDLKPGNVLLDGDGTPLVADFGLARRVDVTASTDAGIAGTVAYMAPEQARGEKHLTTAVDVHALGVILFELLTGGSPFGASTVAGILMRVTTESAPLVGRSRPDVPRDLEAICAKCLEKMPQDRYRSAEEFADDLTRFLSGEPVRVRELSLFTGIGRAVSHRPNGMIITSWPGFLMGAAFTFLTQGMCQAAVLAGTSGWYVLATLVINLMGWWICYWLFVVQRSQWKAHSMGMSSAYVFGALLGATALLPAHISGEQSEVLRMYLPLTAVFGVGAFVHGARHWGRMYLVGVMLFAVAALMPFIPMRFWPTVHALAFGGFAMWFGLWMRYFERQDRADALVEAADSRGP